jgi:hypothetical protein
MPATLVPVNALDHKVPIVKPTPVAGDNVNGNRFANGGSLILEMTSSAGGTVTVSFPASSNVDGQAPAPVVYTLTGAQTKIAGGWPVSIYGAEVVVTASVNTITFIPYQL